MDQVLKKLTYGEAKSEWSRIADLVCIDIREPLYGHSVGCISKSSKGGMRITLETNLPASVYTAIWPDNAQQPNAITPWLLTHSIYCMNGKRLDKKKGTEVPIYQNTGGAWSKDGYALAHIVIGNAAGQRYHYIKEYPQPRELFPSVLARKSDPRQWPTLAEGKDRLTP